MTLMSRRERRLYTRLAEMTNEVCAACTPKPYACCAPYFCTIARIFSEQQLHEPVTPPDPSLAPPLLIGPTGCVIPPHGRPVCSIYVCPERIPLQSKEWQREYHEILTALGIWEPAPTRDGWMQAHPKE